MFPCFKGNTLGINFELPTTLRENKDTIAYLDTLTAFKGEVVGGFIDDVMTVDRHVYGPSSLVILPLHKADEFKANNLHYQGQLISFDPLTQSMEEKITTVVSKKSGGLTFSYFLKLLRSSNSYKVENFFAANGYILQPMATLLFIH